jgi:hypothetical protein
MDGDGVADIAIGAHVASPSGTFSGSTYVVFGREFGPFFRDGFEIVPEAREHADLVIEKLLSALVPVDAEKIAR